MVTGAAGFLGRQTVLHLRAAGHTVTALDVGSRPACFPEPVRFASVNLLDPTAPQALLAGADVVLHLANLNDADKGTPQRVLVENTALNSHVFEAAAAAGVRRCVFASSVQAMSGGPWMPEGTYPAPPLHRMPPLPFDGSEAPFAGNAYGLSKIVGEHLLAQLSRHHLLEGVAVRFPHIVPAPRAHAASMSPDNAFSAAEAYAWLWVEDAARLLLACVDAKALSGFRVYHPSAPPPPSWPDAETLAQKQLVHAPRKKPGRPLERLIDDRRLWSELAWRPTPWQNLPA